MGQRTGGLLLHPTSLPGRFGIGEIGEEARRFADFLHSTRQGLWQVLPLGPTGYGDSPYQCFSAFAGNPLLVCLDGLAHDGLLTASDLKKAPAFPTDSVDFGAVIDLKRPLLEKAFERFEKKVTPEQRDDFEAFRRAHAEWLEDFALFMALKKDYEGASWHTWDESLVTRQSDALARARERHARDIRSLEFSQYLFFRQWEEIRRYCHSLGIRIVGDIPIFVAHDSSDVWAHPELFHLAADGRPAFMAGVPPDYFSATGQLWGNPLYRWDVLAKTGYRWWIERFRAILAQVDMVRLDHFRGFEAYWEIPAEEETAINGQWVKGPGAALFDALEAALGPLPVIAENLGVITPEVEALREQFGWPGMAILQFAFGSDNAADDFKPHNYPRNRVVYTGTHDNDTTVGWWTAGVGDTTRTAAEVEAERAFCKKYLGIEGREIHWDFIRAVLSSVADIAIVPLQDVLGLGSEARMNLPGRPSGNWRWRFEATALTDAVRDRLREMSEMYGRAPQRDPDAAQEGVLKADVAVKAHDDKPDLPLLHIFNMSVGFFGIQHGFEIQFARMSSIYEKLGARPDEIPFLWLAAPMTGLVVQPIIGYLSDKTWISAWRMRRRPYFFTGAILGTIALFLMPNAASLWMAAGLLWVLDASLNITMEPFRAFVADKQNSRQRPVGYATQSVMIGLGTILGNYIASLDIIGLFPSLAVGGRTSMHYAFYACAVIFLASVLYTVVTTPEYPPDDVGSGSRAGGGAVKALQEWWRETKTCYVQMPPVMKRLAVVQFFTWMGLFCMWMFYAVAVPHHVFGATDPHSEAYEKGVRFAALTTTVRGLATPLFALAIPWLVRRLGRAPTHALALFCAGIGLFSVAFIHQPALLFLPMIGAGIGWASIVAMPYVILVEHLPKSQYGIFMGIFNMFIVIPEICVSLGLGGVIMGLLGNNRAYGVAFGGVLILIAAVLTLALLRRYEPPAAV